MLLGEDGAPFFDHARSVAFRVTEPVWVNNHIHVLRPEPTVDARFLTYSLNVVDYRLYIGGSTRDKLTQDDMCEILLPARSLEEQRRIADFLDDQVARIDNIIAARRRQAVLLETDRRVETVSLVFAADIPMTRLGYVADVDHGRQRSPKDAEGPYMTRYVRSANVKDGEISDDDIQLMNFTPVEKVRYGLQRGDTLITEASGSVDSIGASAQ